MNVLSNLNDGVAAVLDIGCNAGALLRACDLRLPGARLAGVDINAAALETARKAVPRATIQRSGAESLPFEDAAFDRVFCTEVLEHVPPDLRRQAFREMWRVLKPNGELVITVPHAGWFAWMDSNNVRFRFPRLYRWMVGRGLRDENYTKLDRSVEWHEHFRVAELIDLAGPGWDAPQIRYGGLFLYPLMDWCSWPFYRSGRHDHWLRRSFEKVAGWDYALNFGTASYGVKVTWRKLP